MEGNIITTEDRVKKFNNKKLSVEDFNFKLKELEHNISKQKCGERNQDNSILELVVLSELAKILKAINIIWTGDSSNEISYDGVFYYEDNKEEKVEITRLVDECELKAFNKRKKKKEEDVKEEDVKVEIYTVEISPSIEERKKYEEEGIPSNFLSDKLAEDHVIGCIDKCFKIKNDEKYKQCDILAISYPSDSPKIQIFDNEYSRKYIFSKLKEKGSIEAIQSVFKKIIFISSSRNNPAHFYLNQYL